jgi:hypothetical protein
VYAPKGSKSINTILRSRIILFLFLLIFLVVLVVFVALSRKAFRLTLRGKVHNFTWTSTRWWAVRCRCLAMSIPRSTVWSFGPPTRSTPRASSGKASFLCFVWISSHEKSGSSWICNVLFLRACRYFLRKLKKVKKSLPSMRYASRIWLLLLPWLGCKTWPLVS